MRSRSLLALSVGLMAARALAESPVIQERDNKDRHRITLNHEPLPSEPRLRASPTPKLGKPTKAEKKAAKRARTRGVTEAGHQVQGQDPSACAVPNSQG
jgi:hypothetical protein